MQTQTLLQKTSFSVGVCALTELENTLRLVGQILTVCDNDLLLKEIIVATPNRILAQRLEKYDTRVVVILEARREGKISALRAIFERATGDILVIASADILLGRHSITKLVRTLGANENVGAVDSSVELVNGESRLVDRVSNLLWELHNSTLEQLDLEGKLGHVAGDLMAVRRSLITELPNTINDDAYMALEIKRRGFSVRRVRSAPVWIAGPGNPADYVFQRSRVLRGHLQLLNLFGTIPTTFEFTLITRPLKNVKLLKRVMVRFGPSYLAAFFTAFLLELVSFGAAIFPQITRRKMAPWRIVRSTKKV